LINCGTIVILGSKLVKEIIEMREAGVFILHSLLISVKNEDLTPLFFIAHIIMLHQKMTF
jgi:hypothetical protein